MHFNRFRSEYTFLKRLFYKDKNPGFVIIITCIPSSVRLSVARTYFPVKHCDG